MAVSSFSTVKAALGASYRNFDAKYFFTDFASGNVAASQFEVDGTAAVVTDAGLNLVTIEGFPTSRVFYYFVEQAFGGTPPQLVSSATGGLRFIQDAVNNDGLMFAPPWCTSAGQSELLTGGWNLYTVGTDAGFYLRVKYSITDVSAYDEIMVGFRKVQAFDASGIIASNNTDFFGINLDNGTLKTLSNLNDAGVSTTSTTQTVADNGSVTIEIRVSSAGVAKSYINGANPTVEVTNFTFDTGDLLMPYLSMVADSTDDGEVELKLWEQGLFESRGLDSITDTVN